MVTQYNGSKTPVEVRNSWATPQWVFDFANAEFDFGLDVCATAENTKVAGHFITEEENSLLVNWPDRVSNSSRFTAWCNPPYDDIEPWMKKAEFHAMAHGLTTVMFVPNTTDAGWWPRNASEIRFLCGKNNGEKRNQSGRIAFVRADTGEKQSGNNKGSCFIIFSPYTLGNMTTKYIGIEKMVGDL